MLDMNDPLFQMRLCHKGVGINPEPDPMGVADEMLDIAEKYLLPKLERLRAIEGATPRFSIRAEAHDDNLYAVTIYRPSDDRSLGFSSVTHAEAERFEAFARHLGLVEGTRAEYLADPDAQHPKAPVRP